MAYYDDEIWDDWFDREPPALLRRPRPIEVVELPLHDEGTDRLLADLFEGEES